MEQKITARTGGGKKVDVLATDVQILDGYELRGEIFFEAPSASESLTALGVNPVIKTGKIDLSAVTGKMTSDENPPVRVGG